MFYNECLDLFHSLMRMSGQPYTKVASEDDLYLEYTYMSGDVTITLKCVEVNGFPYSTVTIQGNSKLAKEFYKMFSKFFDNVEQILH